MVPRRSRQSQGSGSNSPLYSELALCKDLDRNSHCLLPFKLRPKRTAGLENARMQVAELQDVGSFGLLRTDL